MNNVDKQLRINKFLAKIGVRKMMMELIEPMMEITTFVNNKLDLVVNARIQAAENKIQGIEENIFGGKGKTMNTKFE